MRKAVKKLDSDGFDENMVLTSMSHIIASKHTPSEFLAIVRHELVEFFGVRQADVIVFEHNTATHLKGNALKSALIRLTSGQKNQNKHHTIYSEDIKNKTDYAITKSCDIEVIVPIVGAIDGNAVGAIVLSPRKRRYDRQYGETLERVSIIISPYIQSASFYEQILGYNDKLRADVRRKTQKLRLSYEELAEANERKSEALHTASHNLRTPLTGVNGMISMVLDGDVGKINKETRKYLEIALQSGQAMNQVISTVLTASNIEAGKFELKKDKFNLTNAVKDEVSALRKNASEKGIKLSFYSDKKPIIIIGDESRIRQAVVNFVDNAIYYGNSKIEVSLHRVKGKIVFKVEDDGIGVPADEQDKIFDKMFRASNADVHRADGTGFGLYVTKKTIELSGGKVIFQSTEGEGSIFGFEY
jgi:signal transduction histidine kinase